MTTYYYDDNCSGDHFKTKDCHDDNKAVLFGEKMRERYRPKNCIIYKEGEEDFITVKEWNQT